MALSLSQISLLLSSSSSPSHPFSQKLHPPNITRHTKFTHSINHHHTPLQITPKQHQKPKIIPRATQQENENNTNNIESTQNEQKVMNNDDGGGGGGGGGTSVSSSELGEQIKKAMKERDEQKGSTDFWSGVGEEIREIDWPAFNKVLSTTGVVIGVIAGSSVVLLTVNAVLAELSDTVFAGKGVQDFFS